MARHKEHAEHNENLSIQLFEQKDFLDWANTTAFYSALHFVACKILPSEYVGQHCETISDAMAALRCKNKHDATCAMVKIKLPVIYTDYVFLMDCSFTARYHDYLVSPEDAKICQKKLKKIKTICFPPEPEA